MSASEFSSGPGGGGGGDDPDEDPTEDRGDRIPDDVTAPEDPDPEPQTPPPDPSETGSSGADSDDSGGADDAPSSPVPDDLTDDPSGTEAPTDEPEDAAPQGDPGGLTDAEQQDIDAALADDVASFNEQQQGRERFNQQFRQAEEELTSTGGQLRQAERQIKNAAGGDVRSVDIRQVGDGVFAATATTESGETVSRRIRVADDPDEVRVNRDGTVEFTASGRESVGINRSDRDLRQQFARQNNVDPEDVDVRETDDGVVVGTERAFDVRDDQRVAEAGVQVDQPTTPANSQPTSPSAPGVISADVAAAVNRSRARRRARQRQRERAGDFQVGLPGTDQTLEELTDDAGRTLGDAAEEIGAGAGVLVDGPQVQSGPVQSGRGQGFSVRFGSEPRSPAARGVAGVTGGVAALPAAGVGLLRAGDEVAEAGAFVAEGGVNTLLGTDFDTFAGLRDAPRGVVGRTGVVGSTAERLGAQRADALVDVRGDGPGADALADVQGDQQTTGLFTVDTDRAQNLAAGDDPLLQVTPGQGRRFGETFATAVGTTAAASGALSGVSRVAGPRAARAVDLAADPAQAGVAGARALRRAAPSRRAIQSRVRREASSFVGDESAQLRGDGGLVQRERTDPVSDGIDPSPDPDLDPRIFERQGGRGPGEAGDLDPETGLRPPRRDLNRRREFAERVREARRQEVTEPEPELPTEVESEVTEQEVQPDLTPAEVAQLQQQAERAEVQPPREQTAQLTRLDQRIRELEQEVTRERDLERELEREAEAEAEQEALLEFESVTEAAQEREAELKAALELEQERERVRADRERERSGGATTADGRVRSGDAGRGDLTFGFLAETFQGFAQGGFATPEAPDQATLRQLEAEDPVGDLPTAGILSGEVDVGEVRDLFGLGGGGR